MPSNILHVDPLTLVSGSSQFARLSNRVLGLREANDTFAVGGMVKYLPTLVTTPYIMEYANATTANIRVVHDGAGNKLIGSTNFGGVYLEKGVTSKTTASMNDVWHQWILVCLADRSVKFYLDGVEAPTTQGAAIPAASATLGQYLTFGARSPAVAGNYLNGRIAECFYYSNLIPGASEIEYLSKRGIPGLVPGVLPSYYWPLYNDAGADLGAHDLTLNGSPAFNTSDHPLMNDGSSTRIMTWW